MYFRYESAQALVHTMTLRWKTVQDCYLFQSSWYTDSGRASPSTDRIEPVNGTSWQDPVAVSGSKAIRETHTTCHKDVEQRTSSERQTRVTVYPRFICLNRPHTADKSQIHVFYAPYSTLWYIALSVRHTYHPQRRRQRTPSERVSPQLSAPTIPPSSSLRPTSSGCEEKFRRW